MCKIQPRGYGVIRYMKGKGCTLDVLVLYTQPDAVGAQLPEARRGAARRPCVPAKTRTVCHGRAGPGRSCAGGASHHQRHLTHDLGSNTCLVCVFYIFNLREF